MIWIGCSLLWFLINDHRLNGRGKNLREDRLLKESAWIGVFVPWFLFWNTSRWVFFIPEGDEYYTTNESQKILRVISWPTSKGFLWITHDVSPQLCASFITDIWWEKQKKNFTRQRHSPAIWRQRVTFRSGTLKGKTVMMTAGKTEHLQYLLLNFRSRAELVFEKWIRISSFFKLKYKSFCGYSFSKVSIFYFLLFSTIIVILSWNNNDILCFGPLVKQQNGL